MKKTVLVTTNWVSSTGRDLIGRETEMKERETEMKERESEMKEHWRPIIQKGAKVHRFLRNRESAWDIINDLLRSADLEAPLLVQKQMVNHQTPFPKTEAGRHAASKEKKKKDEKKEEKRIKNRLGCMIQ